MGSFVEGVDFDTIAREWRCKWSADNDKESLAEAQKALNEILPILKAVNGVKKVDRIVCGGNLDFKVRLDMVPSNDGTVIVPVVFAKHSLTNPFTHSYAVTRLSHLFLPVTNSTRGKKRILHQKKNSCSN